MYERGKWTGEWANKIMGKWKWRPEAVNKFDLRINLLSKWVYIEIMSPFAHLYIAIDQM